MIYSVFLFLLLAVLPRQAVSLGTEQLDPAREEVSTGYMVHIEGIFDYMILRC